MKNYLPISHPEYVYPPSKNPYWTKLKEFQTLIFSDNETEKHRGHWKDQFPNSAPGPLHLEIGCNAGHVIVEWAHQHPENRYIGLDWKFKSIFRGAEKVIKKDLKNLVFFRAHAERLDFMFGPEELDSISLFFPDPWPRKSQWKNRFLTAQRLREIAKILKPNGMLHIKTDHPGYFEWMLDALKECSELFEVIEMSRNLHENNPHPEDLQIPQVTLFEKIFIREGIPIQSLRLKPR